MSRHSLKTVLAAFLVSRATTGLFVYLGHWRREVLIPVPGEWEGVDHWWLNPWTTYDSQWFIVIADEGYRVVTTPFFPLYPFLLRLGGETPVGMAAGGVLISNLCFLVALFLLYRLTRIEFDHVLAERSVWLLAFFPTTAFFSAVYTESLFLVLLLAVFLAARRQRWLLAGGFGLLAALTRNPGVLIFVALMIEYLRSIDFRWHRLRPSPLFGTSLPLLGFIAVQGYFWANFGNPAAGLNSQSFYHRALGWPWEPIRKDLIHLFTQDTIGIITFTHLLFIGLALFLLFRYRHRLRASYTVLILGILAMHLTFQRTIPVYTVGAVRYLSTMFPFVQILALATPSPSLRRPLALLLLTGYLFIGFIFSYQFGEKGFLG